MSFVDLATLTMHRRAEMESRINTFDEKCDRAISDIKKLKMQAHSFVSELNCAPEELKERFLNVMKKLDEYTYLITDFNLALTQVEDNGSSEHTPVQDNSVVCMPLLTSYTFKPNNLMDALSEPATSTSCAGSNLCPQEKPKRVRVSKEEQVLIAFSSSSTSSESVPFIKSEMVTKEIQCSLPEEVASVRLEETSPPSSEPAILPAQVMLEVDRLYHGVITAVDGPLFWIITDDCDEFSDFMHDITEYYEKDRTSIAIDELRAVTYCAIYDAATEFYYRALYLKEDEVDDKVHLFLVDTGETRLVSAQSLYALAPPFYHRPPYARYCHLAGINHVETFVHMYENLMNEHLNESCSFYVDEIESESVGLLVSLSNGESLNDLLVARGLAVPIEDTPEGVMASNLSPAISRGPPEVVASELDLDAPEYEDPVEAVTGYHNRDEEDICKHYKGGVNKTCFKGSRCTKKHVTKHPDGWTLDRVGAVGRIKPTPLPAPGSWIKVLVTAVVHFDRIFVHLVDDNQQPDVVPDFGVVLPPMTLPALVRDMNSAATRATYQPLQIAPAPGEMVAALYPPDGRWYRACVRIATRVDQSVEVQYIDYGTEMWIKEDQIRVLEERYTLLPAQAVRCLLAGVFISSDNSQVWARAKRALTAMVQDKTLHCQVVGRYYDEITVDLVDDEDYSVAQQLAAQGIIELREYSTSDDSSLMQKVVAP